VAAFRPDHQSDVQEPIPGQMRLAAIERREELDQLAGVSTDWMHDLDTETYNPYEPEAA